MKIAAHPIQQAILELADGMDVGSLSLREIGNKIGMKKTSPQQIKHHLTQMVKYGFLDIVDGKYRVGKTMRRS